MGGLCPPCASSEIGQHLIQFGGVDLTVHPAGTVRGHLPPHQLQAGDEGIIAVVFAGDVVGCLIVLNPEGNVPGLPVCPAVVGCGAHRCRVNWNQYRGSEGGLWGGGVPPLQPSSECQQAVDLPLIHGRDAVGAS